VRQLSHHDVRLMRLLELLEMDMTARPARNAPTMPGNWIASPNRSAMAMIQSMRRHLPKTHSKQPGSRLLPHRSSLGARCVPHSAFRLEDLRDNLTAYAFG
jgi:hypothetical protein